VFHSLHPGHLPIHFGLSKPQVLQKKVVLALVILKGFNGYNIGDEWWILTICKDGILMVSGKLKMQESINNSCSAFSTQWVRVFGICWGRLALLCDE
jgi:hypothetical protein